MTADPRTAAGREALVLPLLFLTVALAGGFRLAQTGGMKFLPPPLGCLVLAVFLMAAMVRAGLLAPGLLMSEHRSPLENMNGGVAIVALFAGSAQLINCMAPEGGLLNLLYYVFITVLLWNTIAARPDRARLLHSFFVIFASAFVLKYVLLEALYDPAGGLTKRVLTTVLEGVALGTLSYAPFAPATGYVAFFTGLLYMVGLVVLPRSPVGQALTVARAEIVDGP